MAVRFVPMDRSALELFSRTVDENVPQWHPVRFVMDLVESAGLRGSDSSFSGRGSVAYPPTMMLALLLDGYLAGIFASRKLEEASRDGTKVRANANKQEASSWRRAKELEKQCNAEAEQLLRLAEDAALSA